MAARPKPLNQVKRSIKHFLETRSATALFDEFVAEVYDCADLSIDDYAQLKSKLKKGGRTNAVLVRLKKV